VAYSSSTGPLAGAISVTPALESSNQVYVGLKDATSASGQPEQFLGLFFSNGLNAGSVLQVPLYYNTSQPPELIPQTAGVSAYTPPNQSTGGSVSADAAGGTGGVSSGAQTPEPLSILIWAALAGVALARTWILRQAKNVAVSG
jgi:hypothetical protein